MTTPKGLLKALESRDGHVDVWTGVDTGRLVPQHRQGGMGGGDSKQCIENVLWLDSIVNGLIESDPEYQAEAKRRGIKISQHADPTQVPVEFADGRKWFLRADGTRDPAETVSAYPHPVNADTSAHSYGESGRIGVFSLTRNGPKPSATNTRRGLTPGLEGL